MVPSEGLSEAAQRIECQVRALTPREIAPFVQQALGLAEVRLGAWHVERLYGGNRGAGVFRVAGEAWVGIRENPAPWALVIKVLRPHPIYLRQDWDLEALFYREGPLTLLPGRVRAPRCYGAERRREDEWWLWLEAVEGRPGLEWEREEFTEAARWLGHFNGAYLAGYPLPEARWLRQDALRTYIRRYAPDVPCLWKGLEQGHPLIVRMCPPDVAADLKHLWHRKQELLNALDGLPRFFCHNDASARNLFLSPDSLVAVDWDFAGRGVPGQEIVPLCAELTNPGQFSTEEAPALREEIYDAYVEGLREAGWRGDVWQVRLGYTASFAVRYAVQSAAYPAVRVLEPNRQVELERYWGLPIEAVMDARREELRALLRIAREAFALLESRRPFA